MSYKRQIVFGAEDGPTVSSVTMTGDYVYSYDSSLTSYSDQTTNAASAALDCVLDVDTGDMWYIGMGSVKFNSIWRSSNTTSVAHSAGVLEYWNGSAWTDLSTYGADPTMLWSVNEGGTGWIEPSDWATTSVNGQSAYWVRHRITTGSASGPWTNYQLSRCIDTEWDFSLYMAETTGRTIDSAYLEFSGYINDYQADVEKLMGCAVKMGSTYDLVDHLNGAVGAQTGEHAEVRYLFDITTFLNTNFTAASATLTIAPFVALESNSATSHMVNLTGKLVINYTASESNTTRTKTIRVPLQSNTTALTGTLTEMGTNEIPALDTFCPEASKTFRQIFMQVEGNNSAQTIPTYGIGFQFDTDSELSYDDFLNAGATASNHRFIIDKSSLVTSTTHAFKARYTESDSKWQCLCPVLYVTYEYNHSTSTSILNSVELPLTTNGRGGDVALPDKEYTIDILIAEPATITMVQSAYTMWIPDNTTTDDAEVKDSSEAGTTTYHFRNASVVAGGSTFCHTFTKTLARGNNSFTLVHASSGTSDSDVGGQPKLILNYTSGKSTTTNGDGDHNTQVSNYLGLVSSSKRWVGQLLSDVNPGFEGFINSAAMYAEVVKDYSVTGHSVLCELLTGELDEQGMHELAAQVNFTPAERFADHIIYPITQWVKKFPDEPNDLIDLNLQRKWYWSSVGSSFGWTTSVVLQVVKHNITFSATGTLANYAGDGSGVTINLHQIATGLILATTTSAVGGGFTLTWYDDTLSVRAVCEEDSTHVGCSAAGAIT